MFLFCSCQALLDMITRTTLVHPQGFASDVCRRLARGAVRGSRVGRSSERNLALSAAIDEARMAMELHVLFRGKLPGKAALSRAMKELGFPLRITPAAGSLEQQSGFMPIRLGREETGVEFDVFNEHNVVEDAAGQKVDPDFRRSANLRWAGDESEM